MSECGCYHGLDCTKISVCSSETAIEELQDENNDLQDENNDLQAQLAKVRGLRDYCMRTISIHKEATNIHFVADIVIRLDALLKDTPQEKDDA